MASAMASAMASDAAGRAPPGMKHKMAMSHEERLAEARGTARRETPFPARAT